VADRRVPGRQREELSLECEAHGEQVAVEHRHDDCFDHRCDNLGCVDGDPNGFPLVSCLGHARYQHYVIHALRDVVGEQWRGDPYDERAVDDHGPRPE